MINIAPITPGNDNGNVIFQNTSNRESPRSLPASIKEKSIKDDLKKLTSDAFEKEVFGAPTFIVNNKIFWGQDRLEYALEELN